jgi:hypothetical protein
VPERSAVGDAVAGDGEVHGVARGGGAG